MSQRFWLRVRPRFGRGETLASRLRQWLQRLLAGPSTAAGASERSLANEVVEEAGRAYLLGDHRRVLGLLAPSCGAGPPRADALVILGASQLAIGQSSEGIASLRMVLQLEPDNPDALQCLGAALGTLGYSERAEELLLRALAQRPGSAQIHAALSATYRRQRRLAKALAAIRCALQSEPNHPAYLADYASCLLETCGWDSLAEVRGTMLELFETGLKQGQPVKFPPLLAVAMGFAADRQFEFSCSFACFAIGEVVESG